MQSVLTKCNKILKYVPILKPDVGVIQNIPRQICCYVVLLFINLKKNLVNRLNSLAFWFDLVCIPEGFDTQY